MTVISRAQWGARPPRSTSSNVRGISAACHWEGPRLWASGFNHVRCASIVRAIQDFHMDSRGWADIAYSMIVCPEGDAFVGRGRNVRTAANGTNTANTNYYAVCYLGGDGDPFTDAAKRGFHDAKLFLATPALRPPHRAIKPTACPGDTITAWVNAGAPAALEDDLTDDERRKLDTIYNLFVWGWVPPDADGKPDLNRPAFGPSGEMASKQRYVAREVQSLDEIRDRVRAIEAKVDELQATGATGGLSAEDVQAVRDAVAGFITRGYRPEA